MSKFIFLFFLLFISLNSFGQSSFFNKKAMKSNISNKETIAKDLKINRFNETEIDLLFNSNLCEILSIKPSDLLDEEMLKKLKAKV